MTIPLSLLCGDLFDLGETEGAVAVTGLTSDSRKVKPGFVFVALEGSVSNGAEFAGQAADKGAGVIVAGNTADIKTDDSVLVLRHDSPRQVLARMAAAFYGDQPGCVVAVTGTNGKSSVVAFVRQIWQTMGLVGASLGTVGVTWPGGFEKLSHTTPDPVVLHDMLNRLTGKGVSHLALEASSHGLEQNRIDGISLCAAGFTNFSRDHLDYHASEEDYFSAKMRLFDELLEPGAAAVINMDDRRADEVLEHVERSDLLAFRVGKKGKDLKLTSLKQLDLGQELTIKGAQGRYKVYLPLVGAFQASNALVAAGLVIAAGGSEAIAIKALENLKGARGRLDLVDRTSAGAAIFVDYAHTPEALKTALEALRPFAGGRLKVVFGCGGDRDRGKRGQMGAIAAKLADEVYVTDDNPRTEQPEKIRAAIMAECPGATEVAGRAEAIRTAIDGLSGNDVLLIAGKGHEEGQIVGDKVIPFSDHQAVLAVTGGVAA